MTDQPPVLHPQTVSPFMLLALRALMTHPDLASFQLAGGTSIALLTGHRQSIDLDLFTTKPFTPAMADAVMAPLSPTGRTQTPIGLTYQLPAPAGQAELKIDLCNWRTRFLHPPVELQGLRLTDLRDSCADKFSAITDRHELKDIWDISELLKQYRLDQMIEFYRQKHPFLDAKEPIRALASFDYNQPVNFKVLNGETLDSVQGRVRTALTELSQKKTTEKTLKIPNAYQEKLKQKGIQTGQQPAPKRGPGYDPGISF